MSVEITLIRTKPVFSIKTLTFLKTGQIDSLEDAWDQCKVQKYRRTKLIFHWITTGFADIECQLDLH